MRLTTTSITSAVAGSLAIAGCGGVAQQAAQPVKSAPTPTTQTVPQAMTKAQAARTYSADIAQPNAVLNSLKAKMNADWANQTPAQDATDAQPLVAAITTLRPKLLNLAQQYPAVAVDLKADVSAQAQLQADLVSLGSLDATDLSGQQAWVQQFAKDASGANAAGSIVRSDLGLGSSS